MPWFIEIPLLHISFFLCFLVKDSVRTSVVMIKMGIALCRGSYLCRKAAAKGCCLLLDSCQLGVLANICFWVGIHAF